MVDRKSLVLYSGPLFLYVLYVFNPLASLAECVGQLLNPAGGGPYYGLHCFGKVFYLRYLRFQGGECGFICHLLGQLHFITDGSPYCPLFLLYVFILNQPDMARLS